MLEVFSGTGRMAGEFRKAGWTAKTIDNTFPADLRADVLSLDRAKIIALCGGEPDIIWFSPPCQGFSVCTIGRNWDKATRSPKTEVASMGTRLLDVCHTIRGWFPDAGWFIENPVGMMRVMPCMQGLKRNTITFCQYGETRMKPTDIWTNIEWESRPPCKQGALCHERAPRGSKTGTQGLKSAYLRGALPIELCKEVVEASKKYLDKPPGNC